MTGRSFNIRVYGLLFHDGHVLVSDELVAGERITKFPGGGMVPGEGTLQCLKREIMEEMGLEAKQLVHFYTTDFFQESAYREGDQVVSIYYTFTVDDPSSVKDGSPAAGSAASEGQKFRWLSLPEAKETDVQLPIDRVVMRLILGSKWK
ncbi:MAG: NUDIX domain-containing protein [Bacteroidetes bacterium]|nr:NUDIX domain-containing protein [Bacteroidota bacterium]MBS1941971.1 NUDIX domain-containing protein [Bacteroidota bacterium]